MTVGEIARLTSWGGVVSLISDALATPVRIRNVAATNSWLVFIGFLSP
jgi:hypothetical protein